MVLQLVTSLAYEIVQASWRTATLAIPAFIAAETALAYYKDELNNLEENLLVDSRIFVGLLVLAGGISVLIGQEVPRFKLIGDIIAVTYFGYLFWKF